MAFRNEEEFRENIVRIMEAQMERRDDPGIVIAVSYSPDFVPNLYKRVEGVGWYEWLLGSRIWSFRVADSNLLERVYQAGRQSSFEGANQMSRCFHCGKDLPYTDSSPLCINRDECVERVAAQIAAKKKLEEKAE